MRAAPADRPRSGEVTSGARTPRRGTVLVVLHDGLLGGATLSVLRAIPGLRDRGWRFRFWVTRPSELYDHLRESGEVVDGAPRTITYSLAALRLPPGARARLAAIPPYLRRFDRTLRDGGIDLVHSNSFPTVAEAAWARARRLPTVLHLHEMPPQGRKRAAAQLASHRVASELVAVSGPCADAWSIGAMRPRIVHECVPLPLSPERRSANHGRLTVGTVGVVSRRKGTDLFVEAAERVRAIAPEIEFRIIGAPTEPLDEAWALDVLGRAARAGIAHRQRADVLAELRDWDVFVLPSRRDPFPISMLEAMASALPVIGTRVDGISEMLASDAGVLVPPDDPAALGAAILDLQRTGADHRRALGARARKRVSAHFSIERQVDGLDDAYLAALGA